METPTHIIASLPLGHLLVAQASQPSATPLSPEAARSLSWAFAAILGIILAFLALVITMLILRSMQRTRQRMLRPREKPTEYVDVWQMHKLPEEQEERKDGNGAADDPQ